MRDLTPSGEDTPMQDGIVPTPTQQEVRCADCGTVLFEGQDRQETDDGTFCRSCFERLTAQEAGEETVRPGRREQGRRGALGADHPAGALAHEVRHEAVVEQRR